jgi:ABC-type transport system substrate-binding protein
LKLVDPDYTLLSYFPFWAMHVVAREVVERYGDESGRVMDHPVGSNAFRLKSWVRGQKVVLEANPGFRDERYPDAPPDADAATKAVAARMRGKRIPQIGQVEVAIVEEASPRLLLFNRGELDILNVPRELAPRVVDTAGKLLSAYAAKGVDVQRGTELSLAYTYFNMDDPVVGGYTPEKVALRRAVCSAYAIDDEIRLIRQGQGMPATQPIPPDIPGHIPGYRGFSPYDPATARALLDRFGYRDRDGDGMRELPDGRPLVLHFGSEPDQTTRQYDELWQRSLAAVGLKVEFRKEKWPELNKAAQAGQLQMWQLGLTGDMADYFMLQFYGPSAGEANLARFRNAAFDDLFRESRRTPEGPARTALYAKMTDLVAAYSPLCPNAFRISTTVAQPWVLGYLKNAHNYFPRWEYLDIDTQTRNAKSR